MENFTFCAVLLTTTISEIHTCYKHLKILSQVLISKSANDMPIPKSCCHEFQNNDTKSLGMHTRNIKVLSCLQIS